MGVDFLLPEIPVISRCRGAIRASAFALLVLTAGWANAVGDPSAEALAARAQALIDESPSSPQALAQAEESVKASLAKSMNAHALVESARLFLIRGDESPESLRVAETVLQTASALDTSYDRIYVLQGYVKLRQDDLAAAESSLRKAAMAGSTDPWLKLNYALYYDRVGLSQRAIQMREEVAASGTGNKKALAAALEMLQESYDARLDRPNSDRAYQRLVAMYPDDAYVRGDRARTLMTKWADFDAGERMAREALALMDYPHARQTVSLANYGRWAAAKRDRKDFALVRTLLDKARAYDPDASMVPTCALRSPQLVFVKDALFALQQRLDPSRINC
jgi:tetratricopeptide (TPR) repeat protein